MQWVENDINIQRQWIIKWIILWKEGEWRKKWVGSSIGRELKAFLGLCKPNWKWQSKTDSCLEDWLGKRMVKTVLKTQEKRNEGGWDASWIIQNTEEARTLSQRKPGVRNDNIGNFQSGEFGQDWGSSLLQRTVNCGRQGGGGGSCSSVDVLDEKLSNNTDSCHLKGHHHPMKVTEEAAVQMLQQLLQLSRIVLL